MKTSSTLLAALLAAMALTLPAAAAGLVEIRFVKPENFADAGRGIDRERNLDLLARHMKAFGAQLPQGQTLTIDVLDVDLAGELVPTHRLGEIRVLKGRADWPRMTLRWALATDGRTLKSGEDRLADMAYLMNSARLESSQPMAYDTRMLDDWFRQRVLSAEP